MEKRFLHKKSKSILFTVSYPKKKRIFEEEEKKKITLPQC